MMILLQTITSDEDDDGSGDSNLLYTTIKKEKIYILVG